MKSSNLTLKYFTLQKTFILKPKLSFFESFESFESLNPLNIDSEINTDSNVDFDAAL